MKLTKRSLGLNDGYRCEYEKREVVQKLGAIEHEAEGYAEDVCREYCKYRDKKISREDQELRCSECPMMKLMQLIG